MYIENFKAIVSVQSPVSKNHVVSALSFLSQKEEAGLPFDALAHIIFLM
jgi:hypothetical protein